MGPSVQLVLPCMDQFLHKSERPHVPRRVIAILKPPMITINDTATLHFPDIPLYYFVQAENKFSMLLPNPVHQYI